MLLRLSCVFALALGSQLIGASENSGDLLRALQDSLRASSKDTDRGSPNQVDAFVSNLRQTIAREDFPEAERLLSTMRPSLAESIPATAAVDGLLAYVRESANAREAAANNTLEALLADIRSKFAAHAPAKAYDPILERMPQLSPQRLPYGANEAGQKYELVRSFVAKWQDYLAASASPSQQEQASNALNELISMTARLPVVPRSELIALQSETGAKLAAAREARSTAALARLQELRQQAQKVVGKAQKAAELDALLAETNQARPADDYRGGGAASVTGQYDNLRRLLQRWQDYLSQLEANNASGARDILRALSNESGVEAVFPRSLILARLDGRSSDSDSTAATDPLISPEALTLDNFGKFAQQLVNQHRASSDVATPNLVSEVSRTHGAYVQFYLGNPSPAVGLAGSTITNTSALIGPYGMALARVQQALIMKALPLMIEAPADLQPKETELPAAYLKRVAEAARNAQNWQLTYRALQTVQNIGSGSSMNTDLLNDLSGYRAFFTALNQERAGQIAAAVRSYLSCLRTAGPNLPAEEVGRRLKQLKGNYPKEFETGESMPDPAEVQRTLYPGMEYRGIPGRPGSMPASRNPLPAPPAPASSGEAK